MIVNIDKGVGDGKMAGIVDYHERKVAEGVAVKDYQNFFAEDGEGIKMTLKAHVDIFNPRVYRQKYHHIDINFAPYDEITFEDQQQLIKKYLAGMGYDDHLQVRYHHQDKEHDHWHVLVPCSNFSGERLTVANDYLHSTRLSRQLEQEYGLRQLGEVGKQNEKLELVNHEKYRFYRALKKLQGLSNVKMDDEVEELLKRPVTNDQLRYVFKKKVKMKAFRELMAICDERGLLEVSNKSKVYQAVSEAKNTSQSLMEFMEKLQQDGVYVRVVSGREGRLIKYGLKEKAFYIDDSRLGSGFTMAELNEHWYGQRGQGGKLQTLRSKGDLKSIVSRSLKFSADYEEFREHLGKNDIELIEHANSGGIYGLSFKWGDVTYKGSALGLSHQKIMEVLKAQQGRGLVPMRFVKRNPKSTARRIADETLYQGGAIASRDAKQADFERQRRAREDDRGLDPGESDI